MKKIRTILKGLIISVSTLAAGFLALALPFKMFANLSRHDMQVLFLAEIVVYFIMSMTYLIFRDKKPNAMFGFSFGIVNVLYNAC